MTGLVFFSAIPMQNAPTASSDVIGAVGKLIQCVLVWINDEWIIRRPDSLLHLQAIVKIP